jgi:tetratricopeptide (TPR) repeat protein
LPAAVVIRLARQQAPFHQASTTVLVDEPPQFYCKLWTLEIQIAAGIGELHPGWLEPVEKQIEPLPSVGPGDPVAAAQQITQAGSVVGSLAYMAPEQFLGEQLDARADLFSLGVVLFECLTGHHPFRGADGADTRRRILAGEVAEIEPGLDDEVGAVLARMLAPDREDRYPSVAPLLREIQALVVGAGGARLPDSIAVLPFTDRDGGDWSGAALADGLRRALQRVDGVQVVPRGQIAALCAAHGSVPIAVGFAAACRWVISGQIQREAGRWEVSAELLNVATDSVAAWSEAIADDLAPAARGLGDRIVESIGLIGDPLHGPLAPSDVVARAMELAWRKVGRRDFREAIGLLEEVLRLEPDHVEALVQFGEIAGLLHSSTGDPVLSTAARTRLERAVELDPDNPRANQWLGYNLSAHGELIDAEQHFAAARTADPGNWQHDYFHAGSLMALPLHAIPEIAARRGVRDLVDPVSWRRSAALDELRKAATLAPRNAFAFWGLGAIQYEIGAYDESIVGFERAVELEAVSPLATGGIAAFLAEALRRAGRRDQAREAALAALETTERNDHMYRDLFRSVALCALGRTHLDLGDREAARASFEQARLLLEARPEVRSGGNVLVQALSGLGCTGQRRSLDRARRLFEDRETHSFAWVHMCGDDFALAQIARACVVVGDPEAPVYIARAREAGSLEADELEVG